MRVEIERYDDKLIFFMFYDIISEYPVRIDRTTITPHSCDYSIFTNVENIGWSRWKRYPREGIFCTWEAALQEALNMWHKSIDRIF